MTGTIQIQGRTYYRNPEVDRFQIDIAELGDLRMMDVPARSHLEILGMTMPPSGVECEMWVLHAGDDDDFSVYGGASIPVTPATAPYAAARLKRAFPDGGAYDARTRLQFSVEDFAHRGLTAQVYLSLDFSGHSETTVIDAIAPYVRGFRRLSAPDIQAFICHASEDKPIVRALAQFISSQGVDVWLDEQEIKVGDSIVQKVENGLANSSHLIVVLSTHSASKPWVTKELSAALMRQLSERSVVVLPLRLDDTPLPVLLADIKYADCRRGVESGFAQLIDAMLRPTDGA